MRVHKTRNIWRKTNQCFFLDFFFFSCFLDFSVHYQTCDLLLVFEEEEVEGEEVGLLTFELNVLTSVDVCRRLWPGDMERAMPVAKSGKNKIWDKSALLANKNNLLGAETGTLDTVAVGCTTLATLLIIGLAAAVSSNGSEQNI